MPSDDTPDDAAHPSDVRVLDTRALKALAHPLRIEIYDILSQFGPQTASSLAEQLGESTGLTSYHLRALAQHDLIQEVEGRGTARERWWERPTRSVTMTNPEAVQTPAGRAATEAVVGEFYRRRDEQLHAYLRRSISADPSTWTAALRTSTIPLTDEQFDELSDALGAVIEDYAQRYRHQEGEGVRRFSLRMDLFPLEEHARVDAPTSTSSESP